MEGRSILLRRDYKNVAAIPALGERRKIYYRRSTGEWEFCSMARSWWLLWAVLAAAAGAAGLFLLLGGREVQAQLSDYTVEQPNLAGSVMCLLLAAGVLAAEAAFLWGGSSRCCGKRSGPSFGSSVARWAGVSRCRPGSPLGWKSLTGMGGMTDTPCFPWARAGISSLPPSSGKHSGREIPSLCIRTPRGVFLCGRPRWTSCALFFPASPWSRWGRSPSACWQRVGSSWGLGYRGSPSAFDPMPAEERYCLKGAGSGRATAAGCPGVSGIPAGCSPSPPGRAW